MDTEVIAYSILNRILKRSITERVVQPVEYKVRLFINGKLVDPSMYSRIHISNKTVDRIVNEVYDQMMVDALGEHERDLQDSMIKSGQE